GGQARGAAGGFRHGAGVRGHDGAATGHGLENGEPEGLVQRRVHEHVGCLVEADGLLQRDPAHEHQVCRDAELGIAADLVFVGGVPLEETVRFYQAADVFVYPSLNETFGLPILEAMACGCPVVTSDTSAMPETAGGAAGLAA